MTEFVVAIGLALWFGVLTSISPCPLATNITAISYIGRRVDRPSLVLWTGLLYTLGRTAAYLALAIVLVASVLSVSDLSLFLQKYMYQALGPILIVVGMFLMGLIEFQMGGAGVSERLQRRVDAMGVWGALLLGIAFALAFCPTSAALFFGSLVPLSLKVGSSFVLPVAYGAGTALPVIVFAVLLATSVQSVGRAYNVLAKIEWWARMATGLVFIGVGIFFCLRYVHGVI